MKSCGPSRAATAAAWLIALAGLLTAVPAGLGALPVGRVGPRADAGQPVLLGAPGGGVGPGGLRMLALCAPVVAPAAAQLLMVTISLARQLSACRLRFCQCMFGLERNVTLY